MKATESRAIKGGVQEVGLIFQKFQNTFVSVSVCKLFRYRSL